MKDRAARDVSAANTDGSNDAVRFHRGPYAPDHTRDQAACVAWRFQVLLALHRHRRTQMPADPGSVFRALHRPGDPFVLANAWDIGSARVLAALGAEAIGTSSAGLAFTLGLADGAQISRDQALAHSGDLARATPLPVSGDLENGYSDTAGGVAQTITLAGQAGLAGASIEDTELPAMTPYSLQAAVERVEAAVRAARALPGDFMLLARADGLMTRSYDLAEATRRVQAFAEAGADCVYIPMLPDLLAVRALCDAVPVPVNVLAPGPLCEMSRAMLGEAGAARISLGSGLARLAQATLIGAAREILDSGKFGSLEGGASGSEIDALLASGAAG
jgi:2-methylisocitrate lyase-like PEP mutase family enzyme